MGTRAGMLMAGALRGCLAFFDERVDAGVDGQRRERPVTPWRRAADLAQGRVCHSLGRVTG